MSGQHRLTYIIVVLLVGAWISPHVFAATGSNHSEDERDQKLAEATEQRVLDAISHGDYERALLIADNARDRGLPLGPYHLLRAKVYAARHDTASQERELEGAVHRDPDLAEAYLRLAVLRRRRGLWLEAAQLYERAIQAAPQRPATYLQLADIWNKHQRENRAIQILQQAHKAIPDNVQVLEALAAACERVGDREKAREMFGRVAENSSGQTRRRALIHVGQLSIETGHPVEAIVQFRAAVAEGAEVAHDDYQLIAAASDQLTSQLLQQAWKQFNAYVTGKCEGLEREDVFVLLQEVLIEEQRMAAFMDAIEAPELVRLEHERRKLHLSLICETLINSMSYLDTGDEEVLAAARDRYGSVVARTEKLGHVRAERVDTTQ